MERNAARSDVIVVGAGVIGLSIAVHLLRLGATVTVVERTGVAAGASGVQPGGVRQQWSTRVSCELARESAAFYRDVSERLDALAQPVLDPCGYLFVADSEQALSGLEANVALQNELGVPSRILSPADAGDVIPGLRTEGMAGASFCAEDGYFDKPQGVVEAFAATVRQLGGEILIGTVESLSPVTGGWRATLLDARQLAGAQVVVAAGVDTVPLLAPLGVELPISPETRFLFFSDPIRERLFEPLVVAPERRFAAKQLANGRVLASDLGAVGDPETGRAGWLATVEAGIHSLLPILEYVSFPVLVDGVYDVTPDHQPILVEAPPHGGLWVAAGFSGHGFMIAPAIGRIVAAAVSGDRDPVLEQFSHARFERSELVLETQIV
ncbi:MAG TPA: FAD-binding oxidoreductase [Gaiellaceae bacterium]|nr:FAD-binding oxidoreductase [Gaiellaceae bacterium]